MADDLGSAIRPLLDGVLAGDREARGEAWGCLASFVESSARSRWRGATADELADLAQDLAIKLVLGERPALAAWDSDRPLEPWLATVVANAVRDRIRRTPRVAEAPMAADRACPSAPAVLQEHAKIVERELSRLSHTDAAIVRGVLGGLTHTQAAARVGRSPKTAQRALRRLESRVRAGLGDSANE